MSELLTQDLEIKDITEKMNAVRLAVNTNMVGQDAADLASAITMSLLAEEHLLEEGVPGVSKTQSAINLGKAVFIGASDNGDWGRPTIDLVTVKPFGRAQGAPDRQPADILGSMVFNQQTGEFEPKPGPVVAHITLFDEINRYRANVQAAINEVGSEGQITLGDSTIYLPKGFFMIGTQNPHAFGEGTSNQASAVADRFGMSTFTGIPTDDERYEAMLNVSNNTNSKQVPTNVLDLLELPAYQQAIREKVTFEPGVLRLASKVIGSVFRQVQMDSKGKLTNPEYAKAPGFRVGNAITNLARSKAAMTGESEVSMDMLTGENGLLHSTLRHRVHIDGDLDGKLNEMVADSVTEHQSVLDEERKKAKASR